MSDDVMIRLYDTFGAGAYVEFAKIRPYKRPPFGSRSYRGSSTRASGEELQSGGFSRLMMPLISYARIHSLRSPT